MGFANEWWSFQEKLSRFEDDFIDLCLNGEDFDGLDSDWYDSSLEINGARNGWVLTDDQKRFLAEAGFTLVFMNYEDGTEACIRIDNDRKTT